MLTAQVPVFLRGVAHGAPPTGTGSTVTTYFDELWTGLNGDPLGANWPITGGSGHFTQVGDGTVTPDADAYAIRDIGVTNFVLTCTVKPITNGYPTLLFGCSADVASNQYLQFDESIGNKLVYGNQSAPGAQTSDTTYPGTNPPSNLYVVEITKNGTTLSVKVNSSTVLFGGLSSFTVPSGAGNTYVGFQEAGTHQGIFGEIKATSL